MEKGATRASIIFAKEYFRGRDDLVVCEVGVRRGVNAENMREVLNPRLLVLVDSWDSEGETNEENHAEVWTRFHDVKNVVVIKGWSVDVAKILGGFQFDLVYIDANHSPSCVLDDVTVWLPRTESGGIICGHDYLNHSGVRETVDGIFGHRVQFGYPPEGEKEGADWWVIV